MYIFNIYTHTDSELKMTKLDISLSICLWYYHFIFFHELFNVRRNVFSVISSKSNKRSFSLRTNTYVVV